MNIYEAKQEARRQRYEDAAERAEQRANQAHSRADLREEVSGIPFGQPILVGHHSERRHRRAIERADSAMRKSVEESKKASHYRGKAASVGKGGISSDDPDAIKKLREQLEAKTKKQEFMKSVNKAVRAKDKEAALRALGLNDQQIETVTTPNCFGTVGFERFELSNNNANIKRIEKRIAQLEKSATAETKETEHDGFTVIENTEENRVQFFFDGKPAAEVRTIMKSHAFRWARTAGAWQRQLTNAGRYAAQRAVAEIEAL